MPSDRGRPKCSIAVTGSWWRPTSAMPKTRSDGARSAGRAMASASAVAITEIAAASAARPVMRHQGCDDEERTGQGPGTDVPHVRGRAGVADHEVECGESCDLRQ